MMVCVSETLLSEITRAVMIDDMLATILDFVRVSFVNICGSLNVLSG